METRGIIDAASHYFHTLPGHIFDLLTINKPISPAAAINLAKFVSKLSPLLGNLIEFHTVELLNMQAEFWGLGTWRRQDPGFPDTIFEGQITPIPGFEIKAWCPLATEMTARFKDSQAHFVGDNTYVVILAWLPEKLIYGRPQIIGVCTVSGLSIAQTRDSHYHNPPDYIVLEPEDTTTRTKNLQQTNTNGYKWQGSPEEFDEAKRIVEEWGQEQIVYQPSREYQTLLRELTSRYKYRLDTNYAKIDRLAHPEVEVFKKKIYSTEVHGMAINQWNKLLSNEDDITLRQALATSLDITKEAVDEILE